MKRVLIFSLSYFPKHVGGAEVAIKEKTDRMPDIEFHMVCLRYDSSLPKIEKVGNVLVHRIGFSRPNPSMADMRRFPLQLNKYWYQFAAAFKALSLHRQYSYDATWAMMAHSCGVPAGLFKLLKPRVPYVLELQEGDPPARIERLALPVWPLFSWAFKSADAVSVISTFLGAWAKRRGFTKQVVLVPNGVDVERFGRVYTDAAIHEIKDQLDKKMGDVFLVSTSRLVRKNALDDVIRAMRFLPDNVHFINLGFGPDHKKLEELAKKEGVENHVRFLPHPGLDILPLYLRACDIFVRPSRSEGFGISFVEAMAAGLPVVATQEGGIADFLFDEKRNPDKPVTGWAVEKDSPQQIAVAVKTIMASPEKARAVTATAKAVVEREYDWNIVSEKMRKEVFEPLWS